MRLQGAKDIEPNLCCTSPQCLVIAHQIGYAAVVLNNLLPATTDFKHHKNSIQPKDVDNVTVLRRLTVILSSVAQVPLLSQLNAEAMGYDLIAVRPVNETVLKAVCEKAECDIISLDLSSQLLTSGTKHAIKTAVSRGIGLEVEFAPALRDPSHRASTISQCRQYLAQFKEGVFLGSGAKNALEMRSALDLDTFASTVLNLRSSSSKEASRIIQQAVKRRLGLDGVTIITDH